MEQKMITIPFDVELAKKIQNGEYPGKIVTKNGRDVRIVCWDAKGAYSIVVLLPDSAGEESAKSYTSNGSRYNDGDVSDYDLVLQVPEWTQFKDGDILSTSNSSIFILQGEGECKTSFHIGLFFGKLRYGGAANRDNFNGISYATEEQKQQLIDELKKSNDPRAKEYLKRFFGIEEKPKFEFEPFDKVLVRDSDDEIWMADFFSHYDNDRAYKYVVCGIFSFKFCIPYNENTKHLLGTTDNWEEE